MMTTSEAAVTIRDAVDAMDVAVVAAGVNKQNGDIETVLSEKGSILDQCCLIASWIRRKAEDLHTPPDTTEQIEAAIVSNILISLRGDRDMEVWQL